MEACLELKFFHTNRESKTDLSKLTHKPYDSWEASNLENGGFSYERRYHVRYIEEELEEILKFGLSIKDEVSAALGDYDAELLVAIYTNGQVNPGVHITPEILKLMVQLNASLDFDIYTIDGEDNEDEDGFPEDGFWMARIEKSNKK